MSSYRVQIIAAWVLFVLACLMLPIVSDNAPEKLGIDPILYLWIVKFSASIGLIQPFLPKIYQWTDPKRRKSQNKIIIPGTPGGV